MTNQNFTTTFSVDQTAEEVFKAINDVRGWWSEEIEGTADKLGAEFTYHKMLSLRDKNVAVIGGSRGVGRRIVEAGIRNGARVPAVARQERPLRQLAQEVWRRSTLMRSLVISPAMREFLLQRRG